MKYTSLSHWNTGHNVQQNWNSVEEWQDYCEEDTSVVWSKLFTVDRELVESYPVKQSPRITVQEVFEIVRSYRDTHLPWDVWVMEEGRTIINKINEKQL